MAEKTLARLLNMCYAVRNISQILTFLRFFLLINGFFKTIANFLCPSQEIDIFSHLIDCARDL